MWPVLFHLGPLDVHTYGLLVMLGYLAGLYFLARRGEARGLKREDLFDFGFLVLFAGLVGSKGLYLMVNAARYVQHPEEIFTDLRYGLVFYGGLIGALGSAIWFLRARRLSIPLVADLAAPSLALGHAIGRLGCLTAGCCWGRECHFPWAITFTNSLAAETTGVPLNVPLHPTQLYESATEFILFLGLSWLLTKNPRLGVVASLYLFFNGLDRFIIEFFRGDPRGFISSGGLSISQAISLGLMALGGALLLGLSWRTVSDNSPAVSPL